MNKITRVLLFKFILTLSFVACSQNASLKNGSSKSNNYYEEINFEFEKNKIVVPVEIEGKIYRFLLDTGAPNIISKEVFEAIQPKRINLIPTSDANNKKENLDIVQLKSITLGETEFINQSALVFDLNGSPIFSCFGIDGFIGSNLLRKSIIQIDADKKILKLTNKSKRLQLNKKQAYKLQLVGIQSSPYIWIGVKGKDSGRELVLVDTGMGNLYDISRDNYEVFKSKGIFNEIGESNGASSVSLFGEVPNNNQIRVHLPKLIINDFEIQNHITHTTEDDNSKLGAELLNHGIMTIDFKNKRFYFNAKAPVLDVSEPEIGFTRTIKNNKLVIGYVWDKELQKAISYGDEIVSYDGVQLTDENFCDFVIKELEYQSKHNLKIVIKKANSEEQSITIQKKELQTLLNDFKISLN